VVALVAYAAVVIAMVTAPSVAGAAAVGDTSDNTPWTLPSMPPKCSTEQIESGDVSTCLITDWGKIAEKGWGTPPFPYETVGGELSAGWKWLGWSYNGSPALAEWEANMAANPEKVGRLNAKQIKAPYAAHVLFMGFLTEIQDAGYRIGDAMAYNFRCTSNSRKDCSNLDSRSLSYHSYGLAVDINVVSNPEIRYYPDSTQGILTACAMPMKTNIPQWVVQTAQKWGLLWGGYGWSGGCASPMASKSSVIRDPMHFEFRGSVDNALAIARFNGVEVQDPRVEVPTDDADSAPQDERVRRVHGKDRYESAAATAEFWKESETVFVATGSNFPDSLAAGVTAARIGTPVLLVSKDSVPPSTEHQLRRLKPDTVYLAGGTAAVSRSVESKIKDITGAKVIRLAGDDRYETAEVLTRLTWLGSTSSVAWMASGRDFQDPLIASAAAAVQGHPFILVDGRRRLTDETLDLIDSLGVTEVRMVVEPGTVDDMFIEELEEYVAVRLVDEDDVSDRSTAVWDDESGPSRVALATSANFPDALAAVPFASRGSKSTLLLVPSECIPRRTVRFINALDPDLITLFGGPAALATAVESLTTC
jgi:putative cell wall-binding protein